MYLAEAHALDPPAQSIRMTALVGTQPHLCVYLVTERQNVCFLFKSAHVSSQQKKKKKCFHELDLWLKFKHKHVLNSTMCESFKLQIL